MIVLAHIIGAMLVIRAVNGAHDRKQRRKGCRQTAPARLARDRSDVIEANDVERWAAAEAAERDRRDWNESRIDRCF